MVDITLTVKPPEPDRYFREFLGTSSAPNTNFEHTVRPIGTLHQWIHHASTDPSVQTSGVGTTRRTTTDVVSCAVHYGLVVLHRDYGYSGSDLIEVTREVNEQEMRGEGDRRRLFPQMSPSYEPDREDVVKFRLNQPENDYLRSLVGFLRCSKSVVIRHAMCLAFNRWDEDVWLGDKYADSWWITWKYESELGSEMRWRMDQARDELGLDL